MKFITLTKTHAAEIAVNTMMIVALEPTPTGTTVHVMGHSSFSVKESITEIQDKIRASEGYAIINHDPKK
jgi:uncharacterized protein YlzI (FlbEa/FlbD family)